MAPPTLFHDDPETTREAIMQATYRALCAHGYADLTIQTISDEFEKSKSLLYHHYDSKDDLLLDFLSFMLERFQADVPHREFDDPYRHLQQVFDHVVPRSLEDESADFRRAMTELRAQAAHDPAYREHFTRSDEYFQDRLADLIRAGVEQGAFRDVDPDETAAFLQTVIVGATTRRSTTDSKHVDATRAELDAYVESRLLADERR